MKEIPGKAAPKILVVEDEPSIADNIVYALSTEGYDPKWVSTGAQALLELETIVPALIILDVGLPDENGFELARKFMKLRNTPLIFVTARSDEVDRIVGLEIGADDYVVKPFSPRELTARVRAVLRRINREPASADAGEVLRYGEFAVDDARHRVILQGQDLELSRYEFRILKILLRSPGRVFTREQLMQLVWEDPDMSLERTVDAHIKSLRKKIRELDNTKEYIFTLRGVGYSFGEGQ